MEEQLRRYLVGQWPDAEEVLIASFAEIPGGYSRKTYRFDAHVVRHGRRTTLPLILRMDPPPAAAILHNSRAVEHRLLGKVREHTQIPVSKSYFAEMGREAFGEPAMVIERVPGSGEVSALFNGGRNQHLNEKVATRLCELIAELHLTDTTLLNPGGDLDDPRHAGIDVSSWDRYMDTTYDYYVNGYPSGAWEPLPTALDAYLTLRRNKPRPLRLCVVHGDFNPSNFLYDEAALVTALIDWENSHIGDPREDLGWLLQTDVLSNTNLFGSVKVDGGFLGHYNRLTGFNVTAAEIDYFRLFGTANIAVPVLRALKSRMDGEHTELLHLYILQPATQSMAELARMMGYPIPLTGGA